MTASRATLEVATGPNGTAILAAKAQAPQRWAYGCVAADGWADVTHQLLGDGVFGGDSVRTRIAVRENARLLVRGVAANSLRAGRASTAATSIVAGPGAAVIAMPGPLLPHARSQHAAGLTVHAASDAFVVASTIVTPGRTAMGERGAFTSLVLRTRVTVDGNLALFDDANVAGSEVQGAGSFVHSSASVSLVCLGRWPVADRSWWTGSETAGATLAVSTLRIGGLAVRGLFASLGAATTFLAQVERTARASLASG